MNPSSLFSLIYLLTFSSLSTAESPSLKGPLPPEQKEVIHFLAKKHQELSRKVTLTELGYTALTTSKNPEVVKKLKSHIEYMKKRLDSNSIVRSWDPAFVELAKYYDQLETQITLLENGVKVTVSGKNGQAVKIAQNHAKIVSGFVNEGSSAVKRSHPPVSTITD